MADRNVTPVIAAERCTGCGICVEVCPARTLSLEGEKAAVTGECCLGCDHCAACCPTGAIAVGVIDPEASHFATFAADSRHLPEGGFAAAQLVRLMASRRSCRRFQARAVERAILEDLVKAGITAPSGTNSQTWTFTLLDTRKSLLALGDQVARFFRRLNAMAENRLLREGLRLMGQRQLHVYFRDYHRSVGEALDEYERKGRDRLFHGATAAIVVGSTPGGSTSTEDALLATQNILLAAHAMGLGSCLIGFAVAALQKEIRIKRSLGIPDRERVHAVIALGYPRERYLRQAGRKRYVLRYAEAPEGATDAGKA